MHLKQLQLRGFKSFAKSTTLDFPGDISAVVGPNGSGKSNVVEAVAWVLGEQSVKSLRGKKGQDLIFSGSSRQGEASKTSKASVALSFSGTSRGEDVVISRTIYRDGANEYSLNNSRCRLKDVVEFLGEIGIGASRHHIISQGEADRILNTSIKERREMIEDALGLRVYQMKRDEGKRKLSRTEENTRQIKSLRNEIQPHLRFLKRQVLKVEKARELEEKMKGLCSSYFSKLRKKFETDFQEISSRKEKSEKDFFEAREKALDLERKIVELGSPEEKERADGAREKISSLQRELGRYEVMISQAKERVKSAEKKDISLVPDFKMAENFLAGFREKIEKVLEEEEIEKIKAVLASIKKELDSFFKEESDEKRLEKEKDLLKGLEEKYGELVFILKEVQEKENQRVENKEKSIDLERKFYHAEIRMKEAESLLKQAELRESQLVFRQNEMEKDLAEVEAVLGEKIVFYEVGSFSESEIEKNWREMERVKIRLEESGGVGEEVLKEYEEVTKRDEFLATELSDLEESAKSLKELIDKMEEKINVDFKNGIERINEELGKFFTLMFNGGKAELKIIKTKKKVVNEDGEEDAEVENTEEGIDISVSLPRKKISSLAMLSGGERALTSIALLFAMSRVNPPPFLILDETDAALDESNSRKYAKLLRELGESTQLVLVTHNRETMEAAKVLYGVTMDGGGVSRLLSIKLEEAEHLVD